MLIKTCRHCAKFVRGPGKARQCLPVLAAILPECTSLMSIYLGCYDEDVEHDSVQLNISRKAGRGGDPAGAYTSRTPDCMVPHSACLCYPGACGRQQSMSCKGEHLLRKWTAQGVAGGQIRLRCCQQRTRRGAHPLGDAWRQSLQLPAAPSLPGSAWPSQRSPTLVHPVHSLCTQQSLQSHLQPQICSVRHQSICPMMAGSDKGQVFSHLVALRQVESVHEAESQSSVMHIQRMLTRQTTNERCRLHTPWS